MDKTTVYILSFAVILIALIGTAYAANQKAIENSKACDHANEKGKSHASSKSVLKSCNKVEIFNLSDVRNLTYNGIRVADNSGIDVATGDLNGDGYTDLVIGAYLALLDKSGQAYIIYGPFAGKGEFNIKEVANFTINGAENSARLGFSVATGDLNNDGVADLVVSEDFASFDGFLSAGEVHIIYGPLPTGVNVKNIDDITNLTFGGKNESAAGSGVGVGDLNNDGFEDLIVGARNAAPDGKKEAGETYILYGPFASSFGKSVSISEVVNVTFKGIDQDDVSGRSVDSGDLNNDGVDDLIIGAPLGDDDELNEGETYVIYGPLPNGNNHQFNIDEKVNLIFTGINQNDAAGTVAEGDINDDGKADLLIGASSNPDEQRKRAGQTFVMYGPFEKGLNLKINIGDVVDRIYNGIHLGDFARFVEAGDLNNDGKDDLIIGAPEANAPTNDEGQTYVVFG